MIAHELNAPAYVAMVNLGARNLHKYVNRVNDLNVFPIPDGDTGDNMMMTLKGGASVDVSEDDSLSAAANRVAKGMLLSARGNSGVILSQFFAGIADGFEGLDVATTGDIEEAFRQGVKRAYSSVMTPTEGTILTVAKEATLAACNAKCEDPEGFMGCFVDGAKETLEKTPDMLHVLKEAGVVDSGGAGLVYIAEGMRDYLSGDYDDEDYDSAPEAESKVHTVDTDLFTEDSVLEFGYCTETLLRLQNIKCDVKNFDVNIIKDFLQSIGNSIVCIKDGSIVKMHVHTMTPYKVLEFCQQYGEFLTVKIENMMLQHEEIINRDETPAKEEKVHKKYAFVCVANGEGIKDDFVNMGVDRVIWGGQTMNPSAEDFIEAFESLDADHIFVLPNNGNIIMAAEQAARIYEKSDVHVVKTHTIGDAYAILSMLDPTVDTAEELMESMEESREGVMTAMLSKSIRDAGLNGVSIKKGDYIGILGKDIVSSEADIYGSGIKAIDSLDLEDHGILLIIKGAEGTAETSAAFADYVKSRYSGLDIVESDGGQEVYDFIFVAE